MGNNISNPYENKITSIMVNTTTWMRDSHGLFDYEWNKIVKTNHIVHGWAFIQRIGDTWFISQPKEYNLIEDASVLATITFIKNNYWLYHSKNPPTQEVEKNSTTIAWIIVK